MKRTLIILAGVLVVLVLLSQLTGRKRLSTVEGGGIEPLMAEDFDRGAVESIQGWLGSSPDSTIELERTSDGWIVSSAWGWPANEPAVNRFLDKLDALSGERRSGSADVLDDYQIDDDAGFHVVARGSGGSEMFHLVVGKSANRGEFIRQAGSNDVYLSSERVRSDFGVWGDNPVSPENRRWVNMQVFVADRNDVDKIVLTHADTTIVLEKAFVELPPDTTAEGEAVSPGVDRTNWTWTADADGEILKTSADQILGALCGLNAADVADPDSVATYGLDEPVRVAEVTMADGAVHRFQFGDETVNNRVYFREEGGKPALIWKGTADRIFVSRSGLSPTES